MLIASYVLARVDRSDWTVAIASPSVQVTSMNDVTITSQMPLDEVESATASQVSDVVEAISCCWTWAAMIESC